MTAHAQLIALAGLKVGVRMALAHDGSLRRLRNMTAGQPRLSNG
jgi:hypothetical protein